MRFLVHRQNDSVVRRVQIQPDDAGRFAGKLRAGRHTPSAPTAQRDAATSEHAPNLLSADIAERLGEELAGPSGLSGRRRFSELLENAFLGLGVVLARLAGSRLVGQAGETLAGKARAPLRHPCRSSSQLCRDLQVRPSLGRQQDDANSFGHTLFGLLGPSPTLQRLLLLSTQQDERGFLCHALF